MSLNEVSPTSGSLSPVIPSAASTRDAISRPDLREAARNQEAFDKLYIDLTNRSISAYGSAGRKRCGLKLHATLAALEEYVPPSLSISRCLRRKKVLTGNVSQAIESAHPQPRNCTPTSPRIT